ncbi:hypothetical protein JJB79_13885 [Pantoea eucrina]|uniref:Uncharacterized protein n=1 Tax=Pantoea eucrina TaxID=472693 RepID=A0ABS1Z955_9GAMM|nr:hypothetical protein [Pantoea eucrina]MBM0748488.1 hypothetical protein [Pantoea eucrina]WDS96664.1 hypothetical protein WS3_00069 [Pantoea sp.]
MKSDLEEKLAEIIIGEAVTELLDAGVSISWRTLLDRLHSKVNSTASEKHLHAALRAIDDIRREMQATVSEKNDTAESSELYSTKESVH